MHQAQRANPRGGASIHSTVSSPGFITEAVPLALLSIQRRFDCLRISEYADCSSRDSQQMIFQIMGFGQAPNPLAEAGRAHHLREAFGPSLQLVVEAVGHTAHRAVNAVPYVCAAATGIRTSVDMPQIIADLRERGAR